MADEKEVIKNHLRKLEKNLFEMVTRLSERGIEIKLIDSLAPGIYETFESLCKLIKIATEKGGAIESVASMEVKK